MKKNLESRISALEEVLSAEAFDWSLFYDELLELQFEMDCTISGPPGEDIGERRRRFEEREGGHLEDKKEFIERAKRERWPMPGSRRNK